MYNIQKSNQSSKYPTRKTPAKSFLICVIFVSLCAFALSGCAVCYTEVSDIANYGEYHGTNNLSFAKDYINSIFPESIDPAFEVIDYSYKAENADTFGFEAFLKLHIEDPEMFYAYVDSLAPPEAWQEFAFSEEYLEYSVENVLDITPEYSKAGPKPNAYPIEFAHIRKILYSPISQTVIFVAIAVYDGGGVNTGYLCTFFEHFSIDPIIYEQMADTRYGCDPYGTDINTGYGLNR